MDEILNDIRSRNGKILSQEKRDDGYVVHALAPLSKLFGYQDKLQSISKNKATATLQLNHYGPVPSKILSKVGVAFTAESLIKMRHFATGLPTDGRYVLLWGIQRDSQGQLILGLGADSDSKRPTPFDIEDQVDEVRFFWNATPENLELLRANYCVDAKIGMKTRVIPIADTLE